MEIEVGEYFRTENGKIHKWSKGRTYTGKNRIIKHSKNIIDLIEVNDIIVTKHSASEKIYYEHIWSDEYLKHIKNYLNEKSLILLQILTHEQFEQNAYRLEEK